MTTTYTAQQVVSAYAQGLNLGAAAILDSSANVVADLDQLEPIAAAGGIGAISFTDSTAPALSLMATQAVSDIKVASLFQGSYTLGITGATVAQAEQLASLPNVSIAVDDTPDVVQANLDKLQAIASHLSTIDIGASSTIQPIATLTLTQAQLANDSAAIALIATVEGSNSQGFSGITVTVSGIFIAAQAVSAEALNGYVTGLSIVDSLANVEAAINTLPTRPDVIAYYSTSAGPSSYQFSSITLTDSGRPTIVLPFDFNAATGPSYRNEQAFLSAITNSHIVDWTGVTVDDVALILDNQSTYTPSRAGTLAGLEVSIQDTAAYVAKAIDYLETYDLAGKIASISVTDGVVPTFTAAQMTVDASVIAKVTVADLTAATAIADAGQLQGLQGVSVQDSAANVSASLDGLETLANVGKLVSVTLTDNTAIPTVAITTTQANDDAAALSMISGKFTVVETASGISESIAGAQSAVGNTVVFSDPASSYIISPHGNGNSFTISETSLVDQLSDIQALQFSDVTEIVASQTAVSGAAVTSAQITTIYAAVLAREPDIGGLGFYENYAAANPSIGIVTYAEYFLSSPEYTGNTAHNYAQTEAGEAQFITDTYQNLLHRAPETGAVAYYEAVIDPMLANQTPGTTAYAQALLVARATVLSYFSQSPEFLGDVQVTASNPASTQHWLLLI